MNFEFIFSCLLLILRHALHNRKLLVYWPATVPLSFLNSVASVLLKTCEKVWNLSHTC